MTVLSTATETNVVPFPGNATVIQVPTIYGCVCGERLFTLFADGDVQCASCFGVLTELKVQEVRRGSD